MTTTNRAFIKVYRHDAAQPTPAASAMAAARPIAMAEAASVAFVASGAVQSESKSPAANNAASLTDSIDVMGPPAQLAVDTTAPSPFRERSAKTASPSKRTIPKPWRPDPPTAAKRPLSAYIARPRTRPAVADVPNSADALRPGTTVASFRWPNVCRVLSRQCGSELDRAAGFVSQLLYGGRSLIGILSLFPRSGCTTIALSLAARIAERRETSASSARLSSPKSVEPRTILVDANFCKPRLAAWLDAVPTAGWQEVLVQEAPLADAIVRATDDHLDLLALTARPAGNHAQLVARAETTHCAGLLRDAYGGGLVDLGAFFDARSQAVALELVRRMELDGVIAVAGPAPTDERDLASIADHLKQCGSELIGIIENRIHTV